MGNQTKFAYGHLTRRRRLLPEVGPFSALSSRNKNFHNHVQVSNWEIDVYFDVSKTDLKPHLLYKFL